MNNDKLEYNNSEEADFGQRRYFFPAQTIERTEHQDAIHNY